MYSAGTGSCLDVENSFEVRINQSPTVPETVNLEYCVGETPAAITTAVTASGTLTWYSDASGTIVITEPTIDTSSANSAIYYVSQTDGNTCESAVSAITVTVNELPSIFVSSPATCSADLLTYSVSVEVSTGGIVTSNIGTVIDNGGDNWTINDIVSGTSILLTVTNISGCTLDLPVTSPDCICPEVDAPVSLGDEFYCFGESIPTIGVSVNVDETVNWYDAPTGGNLLQASSFTYTPVTNGVYYAESINTTTSCISSTRTAVTVVENPLDDPTFSYDASDYCSDGVNPVATITGLAGGSFSSTAGLVIDSTTGEIDLVGSLAGDYTVTYSTNGICPNSSELMVSINELPVIESPQDISQCGNGEFTLSQSTTIGAGAWSLVSSTGAAPVLVDNSGDLTVSALPAGTSAVVRYTATNGICSVFDDVTLTNDVCTIEVVKTQISGANPVGVAGELLGYQIALSNPGTISLTGISVTDILPDSSSVLLSLVSGDTDNDNELDTDETWIYNASYTVTQADIDAGNDIVNTASVVTNEVPGPITDTAITTIDNAAGLVVTKVVTTSGSAVGEVLSYDIIVRNTGNVTLSDVVIDDANADAGSVVGSPIASLAPGASVTVTAEQTITQSDVDAGYIENSAIATGDSPLGTDDVVDVSDAGDEAVETPNGDGSTDGDATNDPTVTSITESAGMEVVKTASYVDNGDGINNVGDSIVYSIEVSNTGNVTLNDVTIDDVILNFNGDELTLDGTGVGFVSATLGSLEGTVQVGEVATYTGTYTITQNDVNSGGITNSVFSEATTLRGTLLSDTSDDGDDEDGNSEDDATETIFVLNPSISLLKSFLPLEDDNGDGIAGALDDFIQFVFTVENTGNTTLYDINVIDPLPGVIVSGGTIPQLDPGQIDSVTVTASYQITQADIDLGIVINLASVTSEDPTGEFVTDFSDDPNNSEDADIDGDGDPDDRTVTEVNDIIDIEVNKTVDNTAPVVGDEAVFTIEVANTGNVNLVNVLIDEQLPGGYSFISASTTSGTYSELNGEWLIPDVGIGEVHLLQIRVEVRGIGDYVNIASLRSIENGVDGNLDNNESEASVDPICLTVYNEFSPNNDGVNDTFVIDCIQRFPNNRLEVYNRWGNLVFSQNGYKNNWTGISNNSAVVNKGDGLPVGTYYYVLDIKDGSEPRTGWLYINR